MKKTRLLIVEDEGIVALDLRNRLAALGYEVAGTAASGEEALDLIEASPPDLVLMDIHLDGEMDGIQAAREVRTRFRRPVVFLTAYSEDATLERAKVAEPYGYILKPFEDRELKTIIEMARYKHETEQEILRLNRLYATLSQVNQAIVRVRDREELFSKVCRVAVEFGGFRLAWVGWNDEQAGVIRPVAIAGDPASFVNERPHPSRKDAEASSLCTQAFLEGRANVVNDLLTEPWAPAMREAGLRAGAVMPIRLLDEVRGVFAVYSDVPGAFQESVVTLLEEAAVDISFALDRFDADAKRRQTEEALARLRADLEKAQEVAHLGSWVAESPDSGALTWSAETHRIFGLDENTFDGRVETFLAHVHPEDRQSLLDLARVAWRGERPYDIEHRVTRRDGSIRWVHELADVERDGEGRPVRMVGVVQDITERREAEARLRLHGSALNAAANTVVITDRNGIIEWVNEAFTALTGYAAEEAIGRNPRLLKSDTHDTAFYGDLWTTILAGKTWRGEMSNRHKDGHLYVEESTITPLCGGDGQITHFIAIKQDVTERRRLEGERLQMEVRLRQQQKLESIGTLAGGVAHEINNPITGIMSYADLIREDLPEGSPLREYATEIMHETERVAAIAKNLLSFAHQDRVDAHSPTGLDEIVESTLSLIRTIIKRDRIQLKVDVEPGLPRVPCRGNQIRQVLMNLMTNARDALNESYPGHHPDKQLRVRAHTIDHDGQPWLRLTVEDHGSGISPEVRERMFDPFFTTKDRDQGTGLGLAISHGIIKEHRGELLCETEIGKYTRFHVDLPLEAPRQSPEAGR